MINPPQLTEVDIDLLDSAEHTLSYPLTNSKLLTRRYDGGRLRRIERGAERLSSRIQWVYPKVTISC